MSGDVTAQATCIVDGVTMRHMVRGGVSVAEAATKLTVADRLAADPAEFVPADELGN